MILIKLKNGWPDRVISWDYSGPVPDGHRTFSDVKELDAWKSSNPDLRPQDPPTPDPVPEVVPMWAFRRALRKRGMLKSIIDFIHTLPVDDAEDAIEHLEYGNFIERTHPLIVRSAELLKMPDALVDDIFRSAGSER